MTLAAGANMTECSPKIGLPLSYFNFVDKAVRRVSASVSTDLQIGKILSVEFLYGLQIGRSLRLPQPGANMTECSPKIGLQVEQ